MKDYSLFEIADFVLDEDFIRWVNVNSKTDGIFWENWLNLNSHKHLMVAEARRIVESIGADQAIISPEVIEGEIQKVLRAINHHQASPEFPATKPIRKLPPVMKYAVAAILVVAVLGIATQIFKYEKKEPFKFAYTEVTASRQLIEHVNTSKNTVSIALPDGSIVKLASNSRISYDDKFDSMPTRDVYLSGQAFFNVKKNPHRPFRVFANEIVAKVLGTTFSVQAFEADTVIQVTVSTGKVSVYSQGQNTVKETAAPGKLGGIIVTPNQQLVYEKSRQEFQKILLENPVMVNAISVNKTMAYEDAPIDKVFDDLGKDYGINFIYDNELLKKCTVTADLANESFYHKLDLICRAMGAKYEVIDGQVVIQSNGCQ